MKNPLLGVFTLLILAGSSASAAESSQIWDPTLTQAKSCKEVESVFKEYFLSQQYDDKPRPMDTVGANESAQKTTPPADASSNGDFSLTNQQKAGVDEPDISKTDGKYIYYVDTQQNHEIHIVAVDSRGDKGTTITLPTDMRNAQLFLSNGKLIVLGAKNTPYAYGPGIADSLLMARDQNLSILVYDITTPTKPTLKAAYEYNGYLQEARILDGKLVLVASHSLARGRGYGVNDVREKMSPSSTMRPQPVNYSEFSFKAADILPVWTSMSPSVRTINNTQKNTTAKLVTQADCTNVLYTKATNNQGSSYYGGQSLMSIITLPLVSEKAQPTIKVVLGSSTQVHVTKKNIYVTAPSYVANTSRCPLNARCFAPTRNQGTYTSVHQFSLTGLKYMYSNMVQGTTYSQYSMDESNDGNFRIVTSDRQGEKNTSIVSVLNAQGKIVGSLNNIAPGEQFYGTRFIDNYLYLVTYHQIDPLFVIDLSTAQPTIVGQLKIPGYSTYLHPYGSLQKGVQYLIGLGYDTSFDSYGNERQNGVKLDLYKIDFTAKDKEGNVPVTQVWTKTYGEQGSQSEALNNPRMFVFNSVTNELLLPIVIATTEKTQWCNSMYDKAGKEIRKECYPQETAITRFAGLKGRSVSPQGMRETLSIDYKDQLKNPYGGQVYGEITSIDPRVFSSLMARVGYVGNRYYFITSQFAHLFTKSDQKGTMIKFPQRVISDNTIKTDAASTQAMPPRVVPTPRVETTPLNPKR